MTLILARKSPPKRRGGLYLLKSLGSRIAANQGRQGWQSGYVAQSQAGTDIQSHSGQVGETGTTQAAMNAMSPQQRMAHLQKLAAAQPATPHYHAMPNGQVAWGYGNASTRPIKPGDTLLAHREPRKPPVEVKVTAHLDTHLGQGIRVAHPDGNHEEMHGLPLHPLTLKGGAGPKPPGLPLVKSFPRAATSPVGYLGGRAQTLAALRAQSATATPGQAAPTGETTARSRKRLAMQSAPLRGDLLTVVGRTPLGDGKLSAGANYRVSYAKDDEVDLVDDRGNPVTTLTRDGWQALIASPTVVPQARGRG